MKFHPRTTALLMLLGFSLPALLAAQTTAPTPALPSHGILALNFASSAGLCSGPATSARPPCLSLAPPSRSAVVALPRLAPAAELALEAAPDPTLAPPLQASSPAAPALYVPRYEWFVGYSNFRSLPMNSPDNRLAWTSGISTSLAVNVNSLLGIVFDGAYYRATRFGPGAPPSGGVVSARGNLFTLMVGPRLSFRYSRFTPFVQGLFGMDRDGKVTLSNCSGFGCTPLPEASSYTFAVGGGLDITLTRHLALRLFQLEYVPTRFPDPTSSAGTLEWQGDMRVSTGLVFRFGGGAPAAAPASPPPTMTCSADPGAVTAGSGTAVAVSANANDLSGFPLTYAWTAVSGTVQGTGPNVEWNASGLAPGEYTINGHVSDTHGGTADCSVEVQVSAQPLRPPTMSCSLAPSVLAAGDQSQITAVASSPGGSPLSYSWQASDGQIVGSGPSVTFDSTGLAPGSYTVTGHVADGQGGAADCSLALQVKPAPVPTPAVLVARLALHSIYFPTAQPTVENPSGGLVRSQQAILTHLAADFKLYLAANPNAKLMLQGHADVRASQAYNDALAERRANTAKSFLVGLGIPAADIATHSFGKREQLDQAQVRQQMLDNPNLTSSERQAMLANLPSIILAQNRRVDIVLIGTGQTSTRHYPFNARDALTLLNDKALQK